MINQLDDVVGGSLLQYCDHSLAQRDDEINNESESVIVAISYV